MHSIDLGRRRVHALGLGTWRMGESAARRPAEVRAVNAALEMGYRLIDTAEMYGEGGAEEVVGEAVTQALRSGALPREELFIVSKVYPHNASRAGVMAACERSLRRLKLDSIDLYLLHWPGAHPLRETVDGFEDLRSRGHIGDWGVSNFDVDDMQALVDTPGGERCVANQIYYSLGERGSEHALLPWQRQRGVVTMAYSPLDQGAASASGELRELAESRGATAAQLALAWLVSQPGVIAIPKAVREDHLRENLAAADLQMDASGRAAIERLFPAPKRKTPLAMR